MNNESFVFLKSYLKKEVILSNTDCSKQEVSKTYSINLNNIYSPCNFIRQGEYFILNNNPSIIYVVKPKDTLLSIANKFNISVETIKEKNKINNIFIGQQLVI